MVQQLPDYPLTVGGSEHHFHPLVCTLRPGSPPEPGPYAEVLMIEPSQIDSYDFAPPDAVAIRLILNLYRGD